MSRDIDPTHQAATIERVVALLPKDRLLIPRGRSPAQGQFVMTALQLGASILRYVGFCVQVRKHSGQFGSDMVFLRHADGSLVTHENQAFFPLTSEQEQLARTVFEELPEEEDYTHGYTCCHQVFERGFLIENSASPAAPVRPMSLKMTETGDDGQGTTLISIV